MTLSRKFPQPAEQRPRASAPDQLMVMVDEQLHDEVLLAGRRRVLGAFHRQPLGNEPTRRPAVDLYRGARLLGGQPKLSEVGHQ